MGGAKVHASNPRSLSVKGHVFVSVLRSADPVARRFSRCRFTLVAPEEARSERSQHQHCYLRTCSLSQRTCGYFATCASVALLYRNQKPPPDCGLLRRMLFVRNTSSSASSAAVSCRNSWKVAVIVGNAAFLHEIVTHAKHKTDRERGPISEGSSLHVGKKCGEGE